MDLIVELLGLREERMTPYQVKIGSTWHDMKLDVDNIDDVAELIGYEGEPQHVSGIDFLHSLHNDPSVLDIPGKPKSLTTAEKAERSNLLHDIHQEVLRYHGATKRQDRRVFDVIDVYYDLTSFQHEVVKVDYGFTVRYNDDQLEPRSIHGKLSIMPSHELKEMDLYSLHDDPSSLNHHDVAHDKVPELIWAKYKDQPAELKKREAALAKDPEIAYEYAQDVLEGPFKLGEPAIAKDAKCAYEYARDVLEGPFKLGEPAIAKNAEWAFEYARDVLKGPFKLSEPAIARTRSAAYYYAHYILKGPFKLGEPEIAKDAVCAYWYARDVLKGPFKLGEPAIAKDAKCAYQYEEFLKRVKGNKK